MTFFSLLGLAAAMFLLAITPGPGVFATVSKALSAGFRHSLPVILGIVVGDLVFLLFAIYGLAAVAEQFNTLFVIIKYLGGLYLIYLGIKLWRSTPQAYQPDAVSKRSAHYSFLGGLSITLGNPKVILFYLGFLPTFLKVQSLSNLEIFIVAVVVSIVLGSVMLFYAYSADKARQLFTSEKAQNRMNKTAGSVMVGTGMVLLAKS